MNLKILLLVAAILGMIIGIAVIIIFIEKGTTTTGVTTETPKTKGTTIITKPTNSTTAKTTMASTTTTSTTTTSTTTTSTTKTSTTTTPTTTKSTTTKSTTATSTTQTIPKQSITLTFPAEAYSKLMVATGTSNDYQGLDSAEVFDLADPNKTCKAGPTFPYTQFGAAGGLAPDGRPLVCGGMYNTTDCYGLVNGNWEYFNSMNHARWLFQSATLPKVTNVNNIIVAGGLDDTNSKLNSSEILGDFGWQYLGNTPIEFYYSCIAVMDHNNFLIPGGRMGPTSRRGNASFVYDGNTKMWKLGPVLPVSVSSHACGTVNKDATGKSRSYILISGVTDPAWIPDTYLLDNVASAWHQGPLLPYGIANAVAVDDPLGGVLLVGGRHGLYNPLTTIYRLEHGAAQWVLMSQALKYGRWKLAAFLVPDSYVMCS